jgi:hypothetical protein
VRISWTISWYVFKDLLKIFLMTSGALAGIMSFGGLLRPLTQQGLDASQVSQLLTYFSPAMTAYSLPIAALFAATVVYGRLSADNELTACRASGISHGAVALPALALGLLVALFSLLLLSFVVPNSTLKVEKVIYSNIAKLIANRIDRTHQIKFGAATVFAQEAYLPKLEPADVAKGEQQVVLIGPTIVTYERPRKEDWHYKVPVEFWTAGEARVFISRAPQQADDIELTISLINGAKFPRDFKGGLHASVAATHFGPIEVSSPIKENVKFMDLWQLKHLYGNQHESRRIGRMQDEFIDRYQKYSFVGAARDTLNAAGGKHEVTMVTLGGNERYIIERGPKEAWERAGDLVLGAAPGELTKTGETVRTRGPGAPDPARTVKLWHLVNNDVESVVEAYDARVRARPRRDLGRIDVTIELHDAVLPTPEGPVTRGVVTQTFAVPLPEPIRKLEKLPLSWFVSEKAAPFGYQVPLKRELIILANDIVSEMNSRVSFALSCLILVMVGAALGMMFRSGNFLTAFAVSFVPALLSITLIIAGQRVCGNVGWKLDDPSFRNPLPMGIALIWSGNVANFFIATVLLGRLWRT